jgi:hypothetical protein
LRKEWARGRLGVFMEDSPVAPDLPFEEAVTKNAEWIRQQIRQDAKTVDIGPVLRRRLETGYVSPFCEVEREAAQGYHPLEKDYQP